MLIVKNLTLSIMGEPLFERVSFTLQRGEKVGLVGPNGSGKSSLFKVISGCIEPDSGSIVAQGERIGYVPQEVACALEETVGSFLASGSKDNVTAVLTTVGLGGLSTQVRVVELSGGQKTRLAFARVLLRKPTFLLLDEPTNHLDGDALEWLESFIKNFKGGVFVISHDRMVLDNTVQRILEIDAANYTFNEYRGGYTAYITERAKRIAAQEHAYRQHQKEKKRLETYLAQKRQEASVYIDPAKGRLIRSLEKRIQREVYDKEVIRPQEFKTIRGLSLEGTVPLPKLIVRCTGVRKSFDGKVAVKDVGFELRGQERILLMGKNGSGKTTVLKMVMGLVTPDTGTVQIGESVRIGYFAQEHDDLNPDNTVIEEFARIHTRGAQEHVLRKELGAFLFSGQSVFKKIRQLSMGERVRLIFAKLTHAPHDLLVLDEPTNHLDIQSREVIEEALAHYHGAILVVSHDRYFVEKVNIDRCVEL